MRAAEPVLSPPVSGTADPAAATANAAMVFPGTFKQWASPAGKQCSRHDISHAPDIPGGLAVTPEAIP
jgi:hypothetical protein